MAIPLPSHTTGHCHCRRTTYRLSLADVDSQLRLSAYCHCTSCQRLNAAPFVWTTHWAQQAITWSSHDDESQENKDDIPDPAPHTTSSTITTRGGARLLPHSTSTSDKPQADSVIIPEVTFAPTMAVYESIPGRKWKQRCDYCGTPMGSWNAIKRQWTIWPTTLARDYLAPSTSTSPSTSSHPTSSSSSSSSPPSEGQPHPAIQARLKATHHQFYGPWRAFHLPRQDGLIRWSGYAGVSEMVVED